MQTVEFLELIYRRNLRHHHMTNGEVSEYCTKKKRKSFILILSFKN